MNISKQFYNYTWLFYVSKYMFYYHLYKTFSFDKSWMQK